jgi:hypothetical protein
VTYSPVIGFEKNARSRRSTPEDVSATAGPFEFLAAERRSAAACRVTLIPCARNQGASTGDFFGAAVMSRGGAVPGSTWFRMSDRASIAAYPYLYGLHNL